MELNINLNVKLEPSDTLLDVLNRLAERPGTDGKTAKSRARTAEKPEPAQMPAEEEKAPETAPAVPATPAAPAKAATKPAAAKPAVKAAPAKIAVDSDLQADRECMIKAIQHYACQPDLQKKISELGYQSLTVMPEDVRRDFMKYVRETYPEVPAAEVPEI